MTGVGMKLEFGESDVVLSVGVGDLADESTGRVAVVVDVEEGDRCAGERGGDWVVDFFFERADEAVVPSSP